MGCGCKQTPLQRVETRLKSRGWTNLYPSEVAVIDAFIHNALGQYPTTASERISLYTDAKKV
jgi:hypothetical protein